MPPQELLRHKAEFEKEWKTRLDAIAVVDADLIAEVAASLGLSPTRRRPRPATAGPRRPADPPASLVESDAEIWSMV